MFCCLCEEPSTNFINDTSFRVYCSFFDNKRNFSLDNEAKEGMDRSSKEKTQTEAKADFSSCEKII